ncbi:PREDICTED: transcription initiation factor TFIID subunit 2 isoform X1 [Lupinus angustifolius]|uniref:transcription initiation factor TFIID subunit 2 isoform X1 n=1 Tax=Lupinus angustifolius TaxID=3871 RepID=UPI00092F5E4D|nr:PREDICTED: transcription initiation factor TFIID subunit 2 isoform X1 [Lupinus angustifolius]
MAKPRKPKNEDPKTENSGALVHHQKLCLSIDMDKRILYGYTELEIAVPEIGIVGLHAENLGIESVWVDGEPTEFEYYPNHQQQSEDENRWSSVDSPSSAADAAGSLYLSALEKELVPNLLINCCKPFKIDTEQQDQPISENGFPSSANKANQNVRLVRIDYWIEKAETGIHFKDNLLHTDNQIRRARCWFPCVDDHSQRCCYDLEFTVAHNLVAVSTGRLLYQVLSKDNPPRKTYVYKLDVPVAARWISLAVAPFSILPDHQFSFISHMCSLPNLSKMQYTVDFFHSAFSCYKDYLSVDFPFDSYKQVFIEPEMAVSSLSLGASMSIFSSQVLFDEKLIDQTIDTRIKLAYALARQWFGVYITPEAPNDEWLLDGLAGFLTDFFIKKHLGNNEARYRRYKANCAVCKVDNSGATSLSCSASCKDLYGTQCIGLYGKIRSWKSVAVLQMLEKQMGPESFRRILQTIVSRAQDKSRSMKTISTKEFRHFANKVGNLERPFLKDFFPRWVGSCGCPVLRMGFSYNKRKNMVELAVLRGCTALQTSSTSVLDINPDTESRDGDTGWPGMMSIRVYELDGMYDHPILPMAGESWQLLEIQCHSKLAARRFQKPKKGFRIDGSDDNGDVPSMDMRSSTESPLLWVRADPDMEYLADIHFNQPVQMWINQLEKDKDVIAQVQAIATLEASPQLSFSVVNALNNFLTDSKAFWRVRVEAAFALASSASKQETDFGGLLHLVKFYKSRRFDPDIGLPKPNDFYDFAEYFVLEAIPHAVAMVRSSDKKSPREAVEFVLQLLKYNDNNGNPYSDVFWLAALVQSVGELEFGQQSILLLSSLLKHIDRLLQFDSLMPSYNGILTISCIRTLAQIALKLSGFVSLDRVYELVKPFRDLKAMWQVRIEACRALLDLEFHCKGIDAALLLFIKYVEEEPSLRGQLKLATHVMRLCQMRDGLDSNDGITSQALVSLLCLLEGRMAFNNVFLRHYLFCILQILARRPPTLHGVPRENRTLHLTLPEACNYQRNIFVLDPESKPLELPSSTTQTFAQDLTLTNGLRGEIDEAPNDAPCEVAKQPHVEALKEAPFEAPNVVLTEVPLEAPIEAPNEISKEADTVSNSHERKRTIKIKVKQSSATSRADTDNQMVERSIGRRNEMDHGASSSVSVDAPQRNFAETLSVGNHNIEEVNSWHDRGSRMTASIGSAKFLSDGDELVKELQCTADSSLVYSQPQPEDPSSSSIVQDYSIDADARRYASLQTLSAARLDGESLGKEISVRGKEKQRGKDKKRKRDNHKGRQDDPEYLERKRLKKEKKRKEKEMAKLLSDVRKRPSVDLSNKKEEPTVNVARQVKAVESSGYNSKLETKKVDTKPEASEGTTPGAPKIRIRIKNHILNKS